MDLYTFTEHGTEKVIRSYAGVEPTGKSIKRLAWSHAGFKVEFHKFALENHCKTMRKT